MGTGGEGSPSSGQAVQSLLPQGDTPLFIDSLSGPDAPLSKAFLFCGWRAVSVDWLLDESHDLSHPLR